MLIPPHPEWSGLIDATSNEGGTPSDVSWIVDCWDCADRRGGWRKLTVNTSVPMASAGAIVFANRPLTTARLYNRFHRRSEEGVVGTYATAGLL